MDRINILYEEISKLTDEWYKLIGRDHHKDNDCHFWVETIWSYGDGPRFVPRHYGYIIDEKTFEKNMPRQATYGGSYKEGFLKYEDALYWLKCKLEDIIANESNNEY